jgi:outer membrane protein assembly factor BamB
MRAGLSLCCSLFVILLLAACSGLSAPAGKDSLFSGLHLNWVWPDKDGDLVPWHAAGVDGTIYAMGYDGTLSAVVASGEELWQYEGEQTWLTPPVLGADGSTLYLASAANELCAVDGDGQLLWTLPLHDDLWGIPLVAPDGAIFVPTRDGAFRAMPDGTGEPFSLPQRADAERLAFDAQGRIYAWVSMDSQVAILDPDGEVLQRCGTDDYINAGPIAGPGEVFYYVFQDGTLVARGGSCELLWQFEIDAEERWDGPPFALAVGSDGTVYLGGDEGQIYALEDEGNLKWQSEADPSLGSIQELIPNTGDAILASGSGAWLVALDDRGQRLWSHQFYGPGPLGRLQVQGGEVTVVQEGRLRVFGGDPALAVAQPEVMPLPKDEAAAEDEIVHFVLDFIVEQEIGGTIDYIRESGQPWVEDAPEANLIVWEPPNEDAEYPWELLYEQPPRRVWWYAEGELVELEDGAAAIEEYEQTAMQDPESDIWAWGYYDFAIVSLSEGYQQAQVYVGVSCGPLCGHGYLYTLARSPSGEWWITLGQHLWQS